jgi:hypothetical protein
MNLADGGGGGYPEALPSTGGKGIFVNHEALHDVYKKLQADRDLFDQGGSGTLTDFQGSGKARITQDDLGNYPAAEGVHATCGNAESHVGAVYTEFLTSYQNLIDTIKRTADNHKTAEEASKAAVNKVNNGGYLG